MDLLALLDALDDSPATLTLTTEGRLRLEGTSAERESLRVAIALHRDLLAAHLTGRRTGHLVAFCEACGAPTITAAKKPNGDPRDNWPTCRWTPGCGGRNQHGTAKARHLPRPRDLAAMRDAPAPPAQPKAPPKVDGRRLLGPRPPWRDSTHPEPAR